MHSRPCAGIAFCGARLRSRGRVERLPKPRHQRRRLDRFITVNGQRLHVVDWGNSGRQPMVLIHGIDRVARMFDAVAAHFAATHHVIAYDMRGHGDSAWDPQGRYLVEDHVGDLAGLVAQLRAA